MKSKTIARIFTFSTAALAGLLFLRLRVPWGFLLWLPKVLAGSLSIILAILAGVGTLLGLVTKAPEAILAGLVSLVAFVRYIMRLFTSTQSSMMAPTKRPAPTTALLMTKSYQALFRPTSQKPILEQNIPFWQNPDDRRQLMCDLWQPPTGVDPSGMALVYLHGGAWVLSDKDRGTRPFFRHLARQGHLVMDATYRLAPEASVFDMVADVKWAILWLKANAQQFGAQPMRLVLMGASAGGHLALLAAYSAGNEQLTPLELSDADTSVQAVVSFYGPVDLSALYYHTNQQRLPLEKMLKPGKVISTKKLAGRVDFMLGGSPQEVPEFYKLASPITHVHPGCPPTLLIHGEDDMFVPARATRTLKERLVEAGVPVRSISYPQTEHGFDLVLPQISPATQAAWQEVDSFLDWLDARQDAPEDTIHPEGI